ncbi:MAG: endonuclease [Polaribacter sp.]
MKLHLIILFTLFAFSASFSQLTPPTELTSYYASVNFTSTGTTLLQSLENTTISKHTNLLSYSERHNYLYNADEDLNDNANVYLMYTSESRDKREYLSGNNSFSPQTFNTEHVYPQSLIGVTAKGDLHHLRACDTNTNSARSNNPFSDGTGNYSNNGNSWFPGDEWKGDVARMIMYLKLRYDEPFNDVGNLNLFLKWNIEDPVSLFEIQRNEIIAEVQGNRNPFIDNPYLATLIWGGNEAENRWSTLDTDNYSLINEIKIYPNPSNTHSINVKVPSRFKNITITLFSILGKKIHESKIKNIQQNSCQFKHLKSGLYLLKIKSKNHYSTRKVIVK